MQTYLEHHGVKGMKWGVRKQKPPPSHDVMKIKHIEAKMGKRKKNISALSNSELKALNERKQLEKTYSTLNPPSAASQWATKIIKDLGLIAYKQALSYATQEVMREAARQQKKGKP